MELISGDQSGNVRVWDLAKNAFRYQVDPVPGEEVGIRSISVASDAKMLVVANSNGTCFVWMLKNGEDFIPSHEVQAHDQYILKCLLSPDGSRYLATCSSDHSVKIWELTKEDEDEEPKFVLARTLYGHTKWVWDCAFSCDSAYIVTGTLPSHLCSINGYGGEDLERGKRRGREQS